MIWCDGNISSFIYTFIIEEAWSSKRDNVFPFFTHSLSMRTVVFWFPFRFVYAALCSNPKPFIIFVIALFVVSVRTKPTVFFFSFRLPFNPISILFDYKATKTNNIIPFFIRCVGWCRRNARSKRDGMAAMQIKRDRNNSNVAGATARKTTRHHHSSSTGCTHRK